MYFSLVLEESDPAWPISIGSEAVHPVFLPCLRMVKSPSEMPSFLLRYGFVLSERYLTIHLHVLNSGIQFPVETEVVLT